MGSYINTGTTKGKVKIICEKYGGEIIEKPFYFSDIPEDKALLCVVDNGPFEAAAYCYSESEFLAFSDPQDYRMRTWMTIDKKKAEEIAK
jgi:hypothetical protein